MAVAVGQQSRGEESAPRKQYQHNRPCDPSHLPDTPWNWKHTGTYDGRDYVRRRRDCGPCQRNQTIRNMSVTIRGAAAVTFHTQSFDEHKSYTHQSAWACHRHRQVPSDPRCPVSKVSWLQLFLHHPPFPSTDSVWYDKCHTKDEPRASLRIFWFHWGFLPELKTMCRSTFYPKLGAKVKDHGAEARFATCDLEQTKLTHAYITLGIFSLGHNYISEISESPDWLLRFYDLTHKHHFDGCVDTKPCHKSTRHTIPTSHASLLETGHRLRDSPHFLERKYIYIQYSTKGLQRISIYLGSVKVFDFILR